MAFDPFTIASYRIGDCCPHCTDGKVRCNESSQVTCSRLNGNVTTRIIIREITISKSTLITSISAQVPSQEGSPRIQKLAFAHPTSMFIYSCNSNVWPDKQALSIILL